MVYRRRARRGRRPKRKYTKRVNRKRMARTAIKVNSKLQTHFFKRKVVLASLAPTAIGNATQNYVFSLNQLPGYTDFTSLFDQYTIHAIKLNFYPSLTSADVNPWLTAQTVPKCYYIVDRDDQTPFATIDQALQHGKVKIRMMNKPFSIYMKPSTLAEIYRTAVTTAYNPRYNVKIDMANDNVPHYGVKFIMDDSGNDNSFLMKCVATFYVSCYNTQ